MGWFPCCCQLPECLICLEQRGPKHYRVELSEIVPGPWDPPCPNCDELNGVYILEHEPQPEWRRWTYCAWVYRFPVPVCGCDELRLAFERHVFGPPGTYLSCLLYNTEDVWSGMLWRARVDDEPDCRAFEDFELPVVDRGRLMFGIAPRCGDEISERCLVTAL